MYLRFLGDVTLLRLIRRGISATARPSQSGALTRPCSISSRPDVTGSLLQHGGTDRGRMVSTSTFPGRSSLLRARQTKHYMS